MSSAPAQRHEIDAELALRELVRREGRMAELCTEHGKVRMDWVDGVEALLDNPGPLVELEELAAAWRWRGIRHVLWSGMGGSSVTVSVLAQFAADGPSVHVLDSTDPAALDALLDGDLPAQLESVVLVAVSMGLTSEEPATHLAWFLELLAAAGLPPAEHAFVLTVPGSRLEEAAVRERLEAHPVFLAGRGGLPGRMSAPGTAVFLLPAALAGKRLRDVLAEAWSEHDIVERSPYVQLAIELAERFPDGCGRLMLDLPPRWAAMHVWIEQLVEQTLGKDGKGVVVFGPQRLKLVRVDVPPPDPTLDPHAAVAAAMLGWQLVVALLGHHAATNIVDEPAVEDYKARARALRDEADVLSRAVEEGAVDWAAHGRDRLEAFVRKAVGGQLSYLDVTINGELGSTSGIARRLQQLGNDVLGVPVKLRRAPAAYHVSEQCQLDGPPGVASLRLVAREVPPAKLGTYTGQFLHAQAVATWQAMTGRGRDCTLVVVDRLEQTVDVLAAVEDLVRERLA